MRRRGSTVLISRIRRVRDDRRTGGPAARRGRL